MPDRFKKRGERIKRVMELHGMGVTELARRSGVSRPTIYRIFNGEHDTERETLDAVVRVLSTESPGMRIDLEAEESLDDIVAGLPLDMQARIRAVVRSLADAFDEELHGTN